MYIKLRHRSPGVASVGFASVHAIILSLPTYNH